MRVMNRMDRKQLFLLVAGLMTRKQKFKVSGRKLRGDLRETFFYSKA